MPLYPPFFILNDRKATRWISKVLWVSHIEHIILSKQVFNVFSSSPQIHKAINALKIEKSKVLWVSNIKQITNGIATSIFSKPCAWALFSCRRWIRRYQWQKVDFVLKKLNNITQGKNYSILNAIRLMDQSIRQTIDTRELERQTDERKCIKLTRMDDRNKEFDICMCVK